MPEQTDDQDDHQDEVIDRFVDELIDRLDAGPLNLIDRLGAGLPPRSIEEAAARELYDWLSHRIEELPLIEPPAGWEERLMERWRRERRRGTG